MFPWKMEQVLFDVADRGAIRDDVLIDDYNMSYEG